MHEVNSPRIKLLYDIYHMQIMEGPHRHHPPEHRRLGHFHTAAFPAAEIDATQEIQYAAVMKAIADAGFAVTSP